MYYVLSLRLVFGASLGEGKAEQFVTVFADLGELSFRFIGFIGVFKICMCVSRLINPNPTLTFLKQIFCYPS